MQGEHPFHNYTIRSKYRKPPSGKRCLRKRSRKIKDILTLGSEEIDAGNFPIEDAAQPHENNILSTSTVCDDVEESSEEETNQIKNQDVSVSVRARWLHEPDEMDRLNASHYRKIFGCSCGNLETSLGIKYVELLIRGESFMLHQVKNMLLAQVTKLYSTSLFLMDFEY